LPNNTPNYSFKKPFYSESADVSVLNENMDMLDEALMVTADQTAAPPQESTKTKLSTVIGWITNRIKVMTGKTNWWETPSTTLENCHAHISGGSHANATSFANGFMSKEDKQKINNATNANVANRLVMRDASGRAQVSNPAVTADIANKGYVDTSFVRSNADSTLSAKLTAQSNASYTSRQVRNIVIWTSGDTPPSTSNGDILIKVF
jgi:hypothetical protein